jgi:hypothetical protein
MSRPNGRGAHVGWWSSDDPRRRTAFVALLLVASAIVGLGFGAVVSWAGGDGTVAAGEPSDPPTTSTSSPSPSPTTSPTKRSASEIERGTTSDIGYVIGASDKGDGTHVTFDRVLLLMGQPAHDYAKAHKKKKPKKDGVLLVNDNPLTRDLVLAPDVQVVGAQQLTGSPTPTRVPLQTLLDAVASHGADILLDLTYDKLGYVTKVQEHDLPQ